MELTGSKSKPKGLKFACIRFCGIETRKKIGAKLERLNASVVPPHFDRIFFSRVGCVNETEPKSLTCIRCIMVMIVLYCFVVTHLRRQRPQRLNMDMLRSRQSHIGQDMVRQQLLQQHSAYDRGRVALLF